MATLRAAAFILNGVLLLLGVFLFARSFPSKAEDMLMCVLIIGAPVISIVAIALLSRDKNGTTAS